MFGLLIMAILGGRILRWLLFPVPDIICLPFELKILTLIVCLIGGFTGYLISNVSFYFYNLSLNYYTLSIFFGSM